MPVKSVAQEKYLAMHEPSVLHKWKAEGAKTSTKGLPYKVGNGGGGMLAKLYGKKGRK
jgi:hypothetical protein